MKLNYSEYPIFFTIPSGKTTSPRTLHKGGGGGDGGAAARKAAEDARVAEAINKLNTVFGMADPVLETVDKAKFTTTTQPQISQNNGTIIDYISKKAAINSPPTTTFDESGYNSAVKLAQDKYNSLKGASLDRENLYSKIGKDSTNNALVDLNKDRGIAERDLNFMLARNGLSGGSRDVDSNKDVLDTYNQGVLKASNIGLQTANNARSNDEKTRVNLINSIHSGLTDGDAMMQAYQGMANNAKSAQDDANAASLAGFFDVLKNQQAQAQYANGVNSVVQPTQQTNKYGNTANKSYSGNTY